MKKRPRGTGSIFKRGKIWFIQYFVAGERHRECSHSEDRKVAVQLLQKRLGEVATGETRYLGVAAEAKTITIGRLIDIVIADQEFRRLRSAKTTKYHAAHFNEKFRAQEAAKFSTDDAERYMNMRRKAGAENATINREMAIIGRGFALGRHKRLFRWEAPYIPKLAEDNARQGFLEPEQYERLLGELPQHLKAFFVCAYHLGTRKGELRKLRWDQVDFEAGVIRLEQAQTKGKRPRTLPIYGDMEKWLRIQQEEVMLPAPERAYLPAIIGPSVKRGPSAPALTQWVFHWGTKQVGEHMKGWKQACERAGVPGLLPHDLRRSAVRNMKRAGLPDSIAMSISGHKTTSIFRRYDIVDEKDLGDAGEKMEQFFAERKAERAAKLKRVK